jgi:hypothetical protein
MVPDRPPSVIMFGLGLGINSSRLCLRSSHLIAQLNSFLSGSCVTSLSGAGELSWRCVDVEWVRGRVAYPQETSLHRDGTHEDTQRDVRDRPRARGAPRRRSKKEYVAWITGGASAS